MRLPVQSLSLRVHTPNSTAWRDELSAWPKRLKHHWGKTLSWCQRPHICGEECAPSLDTSSRSYAKAGTRIWVRVQFGRSLKDSCLGREFSYVRLESWSSPWTEHCGPHTEGIWCGSWGIEGSWHGCTWGHFWRVETSCISKSICLWSPFT